MGTVAEGCLVVVTTSPRPVTNRRALPDFIPMTFGICTLESVERVEAAFFAAPGSRVSATTSAAMETTSATLASTIARLRPD